MRSHKQGVDACFSSEFYGILTRQMDNGIMPKMNTLCTEKGRGIMATLACEKVPLANIVTR